jgi:hypothetical protein
MFRQAVALLTANGSSGLPLDFVEAMDPIERMAAGIIIGELQGHKWSWSGMCWETDR